MVFAEVFLAIASTLSAFTLSYACDAEGNIVPVEEKWDERGIGLQISPFVCDIAVREGWREVVERCE